jgi:hypothetical protein
MSRVQYCSWSIPSDLSHCASADWIEGRVYGPACRQLQQWLAVAEFCLLARPAKANPRSRAGDKSLGKTGAFGPVLRLSNRSIADEITRSRLFDRQHAAQATIAIVARAAQQGRRAAALKPEAQAASSHLFSSQRPPAPQPSPPPNSDADGRLPLARCDGCQGESRSHLAARPAPRACPFPPPQQYTHRDARTQVSIQAFRPRPGMASQGEQDMCVQLRLAPRSECRPRVH